MGINFFIIFAFILLVIIFLKISEMKHRIFIIFLILFFLFLYLSALNIVKRQNIDVGTFDGIVNAGKIYFNWLGNGISNLKILASQAIKLNWVGNQTIK